ncbi:MAG: low specificity L-threonine aldolase [Proteobacteria bacterium]|nr:low specificity L-threonine aldolase [Pseudomonadota bacterium]
MIKDFGSDNHAGICPEAWAMMEKANSGYADAYGNDDDSFRAADRIRALFDTDCEVFFVLSGTAANALALASLCKPYHAIVCADAAHIYTSECGAPEFFTHGSRLIPLPARDGKLTIAGLQTAAAMPNGVHQSKLAAVSLTQATELGAVYRPDELRALSGFAHDRSWKVQLDGARFANACAFLNCAPADISWKVGVDVLCFGGTKNGMGLSEALVFFDKVAAQEFAYRRKQAGQLASKMRFFSSAWCGALENGAWLKHAAHANRMALRLRQRIENLPGVELLAPTESNGVFVRLPAAVCAVLRSDGWLFQNFNSGVRIMCSWASTETDIDAFASAITDAIVSARKTV